MTRDKTEELQTEQDHSRFLEELLMALFGDGWDQLTIYEAKKKKAEIAALDATVDDYIQEKIEMREQIAALKDTATLEYLINNDADAKEVVRLTGKGIGKRAAWCILALAGFFALYFMI